jgi:enterochelin esterase-like enzyme
MTRTTSSRSVRLALVASLFGATLGAQALPSVGVGRIERIASMPSAHVDPRHVDVWLPPQYDGRAPLPVLYMHDGQMLFDSTVTWNRQSWDVASTVARLIAEGRIPPTIVVGVHNGGRRRHSEYYPTGFLPHLPPAVRTDLVARALDGRSRADAYLRFLVEELKPTIDRRYATRRDAAHTVIAGSSMGGLISLYAISEYPGVFGAAAALSTHWVGWGAANATGPIAAFTYLRDRLPDPATHRLWMDHGTTELDSLYVIHQPIVDRIARDRGYDERSLRSRVFPGTGHNERAWAARLEQPLVFLLSPRP